jgi:hypothetical protein
LLLQDEQDRQCIDSSLLRQLHLLRSARLLRLALICQDLADSMTALNDITGAAARQRQRRTCISPAAGHSAAAQRKGACCTMQYMA